MGTWAAASAIAGALGPVLGGWLVDLGSWRAIFLINLPVAAIAVMLARSRIPRGPGDLERVWPMARRAAGFLVRAAPTEQIVGPDALAWVRFGLRAAHDPRMVNTAKVIDARPAQGRNATGFQVASLRR